MPFTVKPRKGVYYLYGAIGAKRIRKSLGVRDPKEAEKLKAHHEAKIRRAELYGKDSEATFADAYNLYHKLGKNERGLFGPIIKAIGKHRLRDITPGLVRDLAIKLYPDVKPQTRNRQVLTPIGSVLNNAHDHGLCGYIKIKRFKADEVFKRRPVDREWIDRFMAHANPYIAAYALFMFTTAARPCEAMQLAPMHLDLDKREGKSAKKTKTGSHRIFYLTEEMAEILRNLPPKRIYRGKSTGHWRVFGWDSILSPLPAWKAACKAAGLEYRSPYEAGRHSFATEAVTRQERNVVNSAAVGNWKDPGVLLKNYSHAEKLAQFAEDVFGHKSDTQAKRKR